jgi:hypothetical protein
LYSTICMYLLYVFCTVTDFVLTVLESLGNSENQQAINAFIVTTLLFKMSQVRRLFLRFIITIFVLNLSLIVLYSEGLQ